MIRDSTIVTREQGKGRTRERVTGEQGIMIGDSTIVTREQGKGRTRERVTGEQGIMIGDSTIVTREQGNGRTRETKEELSHSRLTWAHMRTSHENVGRVT
jgi:hypothetical protein